MEMTAKYFLVFLSLCFLVSGSLDVGPSNDEDTIGLYPNANEEIEEKKPEPLCNLIEEITRETWLQEVIDTTIHGKFDTLKCTAGCLIYTIDVQFGKLFKEYMKMAYLFLKNCIEAGIRKKTTCNIIDCLLKAAENGIRIVHSMGIKIPILDQLSMLPIFQSKIIGLGVYEVEEEQAPRIPIRTQPPPLVTNSIKPETAVIQSSQISGTNSRVTTFGLLYIFGAIILCRIIF